MEEEEADQGLVRPGCGVLLGLQVLGGVHQEGRKGEGSGGEGKRMDAAIDHFAIMGYRKADVRSVVNRLLRVGPPLLSFSPSLLPRFRRPIREPADAMVVRSWLIRPRPCAQDVYGRDGWPFLEDSCYSVVQDALFEMQEEQDKLQLQAVQQPQQEDGDTDGDDGGGGDDDDEAQNHPNFNPVFDNWAATSGIYRNWSHKASLLWMDL
ncbi:hypothetical protein TRIUR3_21735 [Triticum urartu]|uniref:WIYLD domain-containing protein n=2 Tax=Triticinae TaxID=1648030 RepID=M7ZJV9_TRIUA|nr:hypothetical protein TRIUR3_21735 [Triticum urartu]